MITMTDPATHVAERYERARARPEAWIELRPQGAVAAELAATLGRAAAGQELPLAGLLVAVKGNIDVAGIATTAACPAYAYQPAQDATAVARLRAAGAVVLGATNLDQFATGLVGTRSPYGPVRHATDATCISGGSSSGSAVAVALGVADLALGTDTAGSGRVPAAFHGLYGIKPTRGTVSAAGVVPACRSLDVVTVMSADLDVAEAALAVMAGPDRRDPLSRAGEAVTLPARARIGVPLPGRLGDLAPGWAEAFDAETTRWAASGAEPVPVDITVLLEVATMLYDGAFVAERYAAVGAFVDAHPDDVDPVVGGIIARAKEIPAWRLFQDQERLDQAAVVARELFSRVDAVLLPTTTEHPTLAAVAAEPIAVNSRLGRFTNFANLLDLAALAYPAGTVDGLPFGAQLVAPAFTDHGLAALVRGLP
ncbi:allophanate hydrolase [Promicromonospora sp. AC04]|uniref:allophanate hydrolase n=1 Tax=Promicromonospora sp. AC04 TaxID=2135723 RepID=UPI000D442AA8|nr:allophanate hydrolase [Promicromonospora sp. AC04]PUB24841.1 allophanate hydrolase [Promicromonospora sp. AC04]